MLKKFTDKGKAAVKLTRKDPDYRTALPDFKGQRTDPLNLTGGLPAAKTSDEMRYRAGPINHMLPRDIRIKTWFAFLGFVAWYVGVFTFIAYRLSSDDLDTLEKDARQQIELKKKIKQQFID